MNKSWLRSTHRACMVAVVLGMASSVLGQSQDASWRPARTPAPRAVKTETTVRASIAPTSRQAPLASTRTTTATRPQSPSASESGWTAVTAPSVRPATSSSQPRATFKLQPLPSTGAAFGPIAGPAFPEPGVQQVRQAADWSEPQPLRLPADVQAMPAESAQRVNHVLPFAEDEQVQPGSREPSSVAPLHAPQGMGGVSDGVIEYEGGYQGGSNYGEEIMPSSEGGYSGALGGPYDGEVIYENGAMPFDGQMHGDEMDGSCETCGDGFTSAEGFEDFIGPGGICAPSALDPMCGERFHVCSLFSFLNESSLFGGVEGFKSPLDQGNNGNFGFDLGGNISDVFWHRWGIGYQIGARSLVSNLTGSQANGVVTGSTRYQTFVTAGLFHRAFYNRGLQYGVVFDYVNDNYYENFDMQQLRYEISWMNCRGGEFGFMGASGLRDREFVPVPGGPTEIAQVIDQYAFFFRKTFCSGSQSRLWSGFSDQSDFIIGSDWRMVITNKWDMIGRFNYVLPTDSGVQGGAQEAWGIMGNLVWYPGRFREGRHLGPYRALFNVADNTSLMTRIAP